MRLLTEEALREPAVVFAPHQDDETLGCGGTIARKKQLGARVKIIYTTDGSRSHEGLISPDELARQRADEAIAACETLGVPGRDVGFLGIENGTLEHQDERTLAVERLVELLRTEAPSQLWIPYHREPPPDHAVTTAVALEAAQRLGWCVSVYEYPIWFWHFWPFSWDQAETLRQHARRYRTFLRRAAPCVRELRIGVNVANVLDVKRRALLKHVSQVTRPEKQPGWPILDDVCDGLFTELFFQEHELFYERVRSPIPSTEAAPRCTESLTVTTGGAA